MRTAKGYSEDNFERSHLERILNKCTKVGDCLIWKGAVTRGRNGYGRIRIKRKGWCVHRVVWTITKGLIPDNRVILHSCDTPLCCNVEHMVIGTQLDNVKDMIKKNRDRKNAPRGERAGNTKITEADAIWIVKNHKRFDPVFGTTPMAKTLGIGVAQVSRIASGKRWAHVQR